MTKQSDTKPNDGGPAYPFVHWRSPDGMIGVMQDPGMSLRDWFAGQALAGFAAHGPNPDLKILSEEALARLYASASYSIADAMLAARKGGARG